MSNAYQDPNTALKYLDFLNSLNGQIQQEILLKAVLARLPKTEDPKVLDAACGPGWLAAALKKYYPQAKACDSSEFLIQFARIHHPEIDFKEADVNLPLPYQKNFFNAVILNMVAPDLDDLALAFKNLAALLKPNGHLLVTAPNPPYTYPVAEWKRSGFDVLLGRKPKLKIVRPLKQYLNIQREFNPLSKEGTIKITSNFYLLEGYLQAAQRAGLALSFKQEIKSDRDSKKFDLNYQLYRYPLLLLLEFKKIPQ